MLDKILITGAGTGLGREMSLHLARAGFAVYATVRSTAQLAELNVNAEALPGRLQVLQMDVTDASRVQQVVERIAAEPGRFYGVVNNAGIGLRGFFEDLTDEEIRRCFEANVFGSMIVTRACLPHLREDQRGRVIFISSVGGRIGSLGVSAYCSSKFAVEGFGESLYQELAPLGIYVSIVEPGIIKTERWGSNRGTAKHATDPNGVYYKWFQQSEKEADALVRRSTATARDVALVIEKILHESKPKLRYMVGKKAKLAVALRKWLPGELFENLYFGETMRRVTRSTI